MKFHALRDILQNFGYAMPAWYFFEWDPEQKAWMGKLQEVSEALLSASAGKLKAVAVDFREFDIRKNCPMYFSAPGIPVFVLITN